MCFLANISFLFHIFREWDKQVARCKKSGSQKKKDRPSLTKALVRTFGLKFLLVGMLAFLEECVFR